jgi:hypothetical protein
LGRAQHGALRGERLEGARRPGCRPRRRSAAAASVVAAVVVVVVVVVIVIVVVVVRARGAAVVSARGVRGLPSPVTMTMRRSAAAAGARAGEATARRWRRHVPAALNAIATETPGRHAALTVLSTLSNSCLARPTISSHPPPISPWL